MPILVQPFGGRVLASDAVTGYPNVDVTIKNLTKKTFKTVKTQSDGSYSTDLNQFPGGYSDADSFRVNARKGSFFGTNTHTLNIIQEPPNVNITLGAETKDDVLDLGRLKEDLVIFLRKNLTDPKSRGTTITESFTGTGSKLDFELAQPTAKVVKTVSINNTVQSDYSNYFVDYKDKNAGDKPVAYFLTPPTDGHPVDITYRYGEDWIYPDLPRTDITLDKYPRIGLGIQTRSTEAGVGADSNFTDILGTVKVWSTSENELTDLLTETRKIFIDNKQNFSYFRLSVPVGTGPIIPSPERDEKVVQSSFDFIIMLRLEK